jgi:hypothetical protein
VTGEGLVKAEVDLERVLIRRFLSIAEVISRRAIGSLDGLGVGRELRHGADERPEVVHHRLVDQDVAVGEEQDPLLRARLPQAPDDLEGRECLARPGGHDEEERSCPFAIASTAALTALRW